ncbi:Os02g0299300, partial [Oryza sativa Japonica Group]
RRPPARDREDAVLRGQPRRPIGGGGGGRRGGRCADFLPEIRPWRHQGAPHHRVRGDARVVGPAGEGPDGRRRARRRGGAEVCCFDNRGIGRSSVPPHKSQYT